jgi:hypothetical protein
MCSWLVGLRLLRNGKAQCGHRLSITVNEVLNVAKDMVSVKDRSLETDTNGFVTIW